MIAVNGTDREWTRHRYILWFGPYGSTKLMVWADHLGDAFDEAMDWLADNAPGLLADEQVAEEYNRAIAEGMGENGAWDRAQADMSCGGNCGNYVASWEWGLVAEDPTRAEIKALQERNHD